MFPRAPEFPDDLVWINATTRPLRLADLAGRVVLLSFWTFDCINCLHTLPVLQRLADAFAGELAIVSIHCPKFPNGLDPAQVRQAIDRFDVRHAVVCDPRRELLHAYGVEAVPTVVVVNPAGEWVGSGAGEPDFQTLYEILDELVTPHRGQQNAKRFGVEIERLGLASPAANLRFPGKLLASGNRVFVADTGHHQVVELQRGDWNETRRFGSARPCLEDGHDVAGFHHPNGLALDPETQRLFVADTGNHALRVIDLVDGRVQTLAGTGEIGLGEPTGRGSAKTTALRSPWDLAWDGRRQTLYIAMAGIHQIWAYDDDEQTLRVLAGSGKERRRDGSVAEASFGQPSGLALIGDRLYVADTQNSCVREIALDTRAVRTICGGGLFQFGDTDGERDAVRLQHPMGIAALDETHVLLVDSYNHKVKRIDVETGRCETMWGNGRAGRETGHMDPARPCFDNPEGIWVSGGVFIADTGNHRVIEIDAATGLYVPLLTGSPHGRVHIHP